MNRIINNNMHTNIINIEETVTFLVAVFSIFMKKIRLSGQKTEIISLLLAEACFDYYKREVFNLPGKKKNKIDAAADRQTMAELYETYEQKMFVIAKAILHDDWQAEDAVHEAFVRMVPYLPRCRDVNDGKTKVLIVRVIKSAAIDIYRKNKKENMYRSDSEEDWIEDRHNPVEAYLATLSAGEMLNKIIGQLSNDDRTIIKMNCYYGMPVKDIGEILGISADNVYKRLSRARKRVKEIIAEGACEDVKQKLG